MAGDIATGEQFSTGLGVMGRGGMCKLFFKDCIGLIELAGIVGVVFVGRSKVEKMELLAKDLGLLSHGVPVEVTNEDGACEGRSHDANRKLHHKVVDDVVVVIVGHGMMVRVNHLSNGVGGLGGRFKNEFLESCIQSGRDDNGCTSLISAWRG